MTEIPDHDWKCAGCGKSTPARVSICDCPTNVVYKRVNGKPTEEWKINLPSSDDLAARLMDARISDPNLIWLMRQDAKNNIEDLTHQIERLRADLDAKQDVLPMPTWRDLDFETRRTVSLLMQQMGGPATRYTNIREAIALASRRQHDEGNG